MDQEFNLHDRLLTDFGVDLPISGGIGNSRESPIVIHFRNPNEYVATEYTVLRLLGIGRGIEWEFIQAHTFLVEDRRLEQMKIKTVELTETERITQIENYYFDITDCFGRV